MAYFPNSCAGEVLDEQCHDCPLGAGWSGSPDQRRMFADERPMRPCPVAFVQLAHNYTQIRGSGCDRTADFLEQMAKIAPPKFVERENNIGYGSSETQLKTAIEWLRSDDFRDAMNLLIDEDGICQVRKLLVEIRDEQG